MRRGHAGDRRTSSRVEVKGFLLLLRKLGRARRFKQCRPLVEFFWCYVERAGWEMQFALSDPFVQTPGRHHELSLPITDRDTLGGATTVES